MIIDKTDWQMKIIPKGYHESKNTRKCKKINPVGMI